MKICLVSQEYPPETGGGGIGTQTYLKAHGLAARGHEIHVVSASWDQQARTYRDGAATIHRIPAPELDVPCYEQSTYWLAYSMKVAGKLNQLSQQIAFDIVQFPEYAGEGFIYQTDTFRYRTARYVVQCHGPLAMFAAYMSWPETESTLYQIGCFMERAAIHHADLVLASSYCTAAFCARQYDYPVKNIQVIYSGIDTTLFSPQPGSVDDRFPRILFVGNLVRNKGFDLLIETVIRLRRRYPRILLRMIGKGDEDHVQQIRERIAAVGAAASIDFKGYLAYAELPDHYAWCDLFAGPSVYESGPGNVYLEAMACSRPVVACNTGGVPEVVQDGEQGLLIPPNDTEALERAIVALAGNAELRRRLGRNGRIWVEENVSLEQYTDKVEKLYKGLVAG